MRSAPARAALAGLVLAVLPLAALVAPVVAPAGAAPTSDRSVTIRKVEASAPPQVVVSALVTGPTPDLGSFALRENGQLQRGVRVRPIGNTRTPIGIVLAIDTSGSMRGAKLQQAKAAAKQFVAHKLDNDQIAVIAFSTQATVVVNFSDDATRLSLAIDGLTASGQTALWDGVTTAGTLLAERPELQPNLVVLSDGADTTSATTALGARQAALSARAAVFCIGLLGGEYDEAALRELAAATGGLYVDTNDPRRLDEAYAGVQRALQSQYQLSYRSSAEGTVELVLAVGAVSSEPASVNLGAVAQGVETRPEVVDPGPGPWFLRSAAGKLLAPLLLLAAVALVGVVATLIWVRDGPSLEARLRPYTEASGGQLEVLEEPSRRWSHFLVDSSLVRRGVEATARFADRLRVLPWLEVKLEQAELPVRAPEALFFAGVAALVLTLLGLLAAGLPGAGLAALVSGLGPLALLDFRATRRQRRFTTQLPDALQLLAGSLRAGYSLQQGIDAVAREVDDPMGHELRRVLAETHLGLPMEVALQEAARRMGSPDFDWAVMAIRVQREMGGNLAQLLASVSETMIVRERLRREVRALTAEGRMSAVVLAVLPAALAGILYVVNPTYVSPLLHDPVGQLMLAASAVLVVVGFFWMRKLAAIEA